MDYIILSVTLLAIGIIGLVTKHDLIKMLIAIEMITAAATMNFVVFGSLMDNSLGQAFLILALSVDACVTAVALALAITIYKKLNISNVRDLSEANDEETEQNKQQVKEDA
ncbi:MAG: NADH-quinone oxidoreductase subunit K [Candidatus Bathyarchaeota archaeon]|nr:NADH-quinone oxidoreductase subunit K [Candidatus Bathyarchaeum tardum]WGM88884.1 MAG: NADH-quinone oxidoreductase subunit K [Candidatus Bathyarchaeum tardum]WNZ28874.1 MAG: NADH-quinone oxidoreductase subunit K [Candidatus Bathyarchaeota archaeon]